MGLESLWRAWVGDTEINEMPALATGLLETKAVVQVAAGYVHTVTCLTVDGLVFVCDRVDFGQLGVGEEDGVMPTLVRG